MRKVIDFFEGKGYPPVLTEQHIKRVKKIVDLADKNKVSLLWGQSGLSKNYYYFK